MSSQFTTRLNSLRNAMKAKSFKGFIIPSGDPHLSEYIAPSDKHREYISGFSGSSGVSVVTETEAALWTDGRYYNQANLQLDPSLWKLMRDGEPQTPSITDWLISQVGKEGGAVGVQGTKISQYLGQMWKDSLSHEGINLISIEEDIFDEFWEDKPKRPSSKINIHPIEYSGRSTASKVGEIRQKMKEKNTNLLVIAALDEIAWLLNIRGSDIPFNPVVFSYILLTDEKIYWFVEKERVTEEILNFLDGQVIIDDYDNLFPFLKSYAESDSTYFIWMDPNKCSLSLYNNVPAKKVYFDLSPISIPKAIKNEVEIKGFKECSVRDCAAIIEYFSTLEEKINNGEIINECEAADILHSIRLKKELFVSESFETISSTGANGAIIHYKPEPETCSVIEKNSLYLCDSGSQYRDGTTDITRTIIFGEATQHEKQCYTRVLQGSISLSSTVFPHGTTGNTLDVIARYKLWQDGLDYMHGTGHGVGSYLNVHEGPTLISFRTSRYPSPLLPGMTVTIEPGYYSDGNFGIRLENDMIIVEAQTPFKFGGKSFYTFESLTWVPYQTKLIDASLLSKSEIEWVNRYNQTCWEKISPLLSGKSLEYLERECKPIVI